MSEKKVVFFPNLDGLRFVAFFSVFLAHSFFTTDPALLGSPLLQGLTFVTSRGILGVNFFFVLSGFLITYLLLVEKESKGTVNVKYFYFRRFLRIWPLYYAIVIFGFLVLPWAYGFVGKQLENSGDLLLYLTFLSNYDKTTGTAILGVLWSIAVEEQFYLIWPLVFFLVKSKNHAYVFYVIIIFSMIYRIVFEHDPDVLFKHTVSCISDMAVGGLGAYWAFSGLAQEKLKNFSKSGIALVYLIGLGLILTRSFWNTAFYGVYASERLIYSLFFLFVVLEQNYAENSLFKMQSFKWISKLGIYTYGLYMVHFISIYFVNLVFDRIGWNKSLFDLIVLETSIAFAGAVLLAIASFYVLENPFLKIKSKFSYIVKN
ncbi:MAG: acyltransferase [Pyrinomonadaceae bacterium]